MPEWKNTLEVRNFLRKVHPGLVREEAAEVLERSLPFDWQRLIWRHGRDRVFDCLRHNDTLGGAMRRLR